MLEKTHGDTVSRRSNNQLANNQSKVRQKQKHKPKQKDQAWTIKDLYQQDGTLSIKIKYHLAEGIDVLGIFKIRGFW